jgi:CubicO group peptidase (beta-lactamase class C family)
LYNNFFSYFGVLFYLYSHLGILLAMAVAPPINSKTAFTMLVRTFFFTIFGLFLAVGSEQRLDLFKKHKPTNPVAVNMCKQQYCNLSIDSLMKVVTTGEKGYHGVILVAENGKPIYKRAFGCVRKDTTKKFDTSYCMQLASVSKPLTAIGIMLLAEKGLLNYDDDIKKWFPKLRYNGITVKHLLQHTSGLPDYINDNYLFIKYVKGKNTVWTNADLLNVLVKNKISLRFSTGKKFSYSNTGYALLASIIEKVSGKTYPAYMKEKVFEPLDMKNTFVYEQSMKTAIEHIRHDYREGIMGAKGIYSTVDDMLRLDQALYTEKLLSKASLDSAYKNGLTDKKENFEYGYGWRMRTSQTGERIIYHRGFWEDANPMFIRFVDCNRTIISLHHPTNTDHWGFVETIEQILNESEGICQDF